MSYRARAVALIVLACSVAACQLKPGPVAAKPAAKAPAKPATSQVISDGGSSLDAGSGVVANNGGNLIGHDGGELIGSDGDNLTATDTGARAPGPPGGLAVVNGSATDAPLVDTPASPSPTPAGR